jgi:hypothetical protein
VGVIVETRHKQMQTDRWSFPRKINRKLQADFAGQSVLHLFGGKASFGVRMDIDAVVKPDIIGDAWLPPFLDQSFDVVILDPPYNGINRQAQFSLLLTAASLARRTVVWFHTQWRGNDGPWIKLQAAWLVVCGTGCAIRCLQYFSTTEVRARRPTNFRSGPAIKYNRWMASPQGLPFG